MKHRQVLVTGGAGFLGSNLVYHLLESGCEVTVVDNFSRGIGCRVNAAWLRQNDNASSLNITHADIRNHSRLKKLVEKHDTVVHAAGQTSVPVSLKDPRLDFDVNVLGTFNLLEICRNSGTKSFVYIGSNKVYGSSDLKLIERKRRFDYKSCTEGIDETFPVRPLDPYGLSKASAESYVLMYHLRYGLKATVLRFSLFYGPRQWGTEEQGFVAWFCVAQLLKLPIHIYGNGKQVRDLLYVSDAVSAIVSAIQRIDAVQGLCINVGGGKQNSVSVLELLDHLQAFSKTKAKPAIRDWRADDVRCFYTNIARAKKLLRWEPKIPWRIGTRKLYDFVESNASILNKIYTKSS